MDARVFDARGNGDGLVTNTITGNHNGHISDYTSLVVLNTNDQIASDVCQMPTTEGSDGHISPSGGVFCLQGNGIDRSDQAGCGGRGWREDVCYTLNTMDRPAVVYSIDNHPMDGRIGIIENGVAQSICGGGKSDHMPIVMVRKNEIVTHRRWRAWTIGNGQANQLYLQNTAGALNCMDEQQIVLMLLED